MTGVLRLSKPALVSTFETARSSNEHKESTSDGKLRFVMFLSWNVSADIVKADIITPDDQNAACTAASPPNVTAEVSAAQP
jgi:hypothetical protein